MKERLIDKVINNVSIGRELYRIDKDVNTLIKLRKSKTFTDNCNCKDDCDDTIKIKELADVLEMISGKFYCLVKKYWKEICNNPLLTKLMVNIASKINNETSFYRKYDIRYIPNSDKKL